MTRRASNWQKRLKNGVEGKKIPKSRIPIDAVAIVLIRCISIRGCVFFPIVGPSVRRSIGPSVRWSVGPLVRWSVGPSVRRSVGPSVHRSIGPSVRRSVGPSVRRSIGPSVRRSVGPSVHQYSKKFLSDFALRYGGY